VNRHYLVKFLITELKQKAIIKG